MWICSLGWRESIFHENIHWFSLSSRTKHMSVHADKWKKEKNFPCRKSNQDVERMWKISHRSSIEWETQENKVCELKWFFLPRLLTLIYFLDIDLFQKSAHAFDIQRQKCKWSSLPKYIQSRRLLLSEEWKVNENQVSIFFNETNPCM